MTTVPIGPFAPGNLVQDILQGWFGTYVTVNYQGSRAIESEVVSDVASFGRQIGWLSEIVVALAEGEDMAKVKALSDLRAAMRKIAEIKARRGANARDTARQALEAYRREDPAGYRRMVERLAADLGRAPT